MKNPTCTSAQFLPTAPVYYSVDCGFQYVRQVNHYLSPLGYTIGEMSLQKNYFLGYTLRLHFSQAVPSLIMETMMEYLSIESPREAYLHDN